jgi:hypothetical protein
MSAACERDECDEVGHVYYRYGLTISDGPFTFGSAATSLPDQPIALCSEHALDAFGFAFTVLPACNEAIR